MNRCVVLARRPTGVAQAGDFRIESRDLPPLADGEVLVANRYLSVEPAMRGWIADAGNYSAPVAIGAVMRSLAAGVVEQSRHPDWRPGDRVTGWFGWQERAVVGADAIVRRVVEDDLDLSLSLGVLGINGVTAMLALETIGRPAPGDTVVVSTAAGAVGSVVGQLAKAAGCRTVGVAGGPDKARLAVEAFGYDACLDYRAPDFADRLADAAGEGVDVYFDNTSGPISDAVMRHLAVGARVVVCGTAAVADWSDWPAGPRVERHLLVKRARMEGFVVFDHLARWEETVARLAALVRAGGLAWREDRLDGLDAAPDALAGLYRGENLGKRVIAL